jgi:hypothetical protein
VRSACRKRANFGSRRSYSITSSARARKASGMVSPIAFAVLRLMTSSNLVGCLTGVERIASEIQKQDKHAGHSLICAVRSEPPNVIHALQWRVRMKRSIFFKF